MGNDKKELEVVQKVAWAEMTHNSWLDCSRIEPRMTQDSQEFMCRIRKRWSRVKQSIVIII